jgi:uncharacterized protein
MVHERHRELGETIDATPWLDTHEHLVDEHHRLGPDPYTFTVAAVGDIPVTIASDWTALIDFYTLSDLSLAGMPTTAVEQLHRSERSPSEKWAMVEPFLAPVRNAGFARAMDISIERLFGLRLGEDTVEEIDARARALRVEGYYAHVLGEVANISRCHVNTADEDPFCETRHPDLLPQDLALTPLVWGEYPSLEQASGIEVGSLEDYLRVVDWCFERYADLAIAVKLDWAHQRGLAVEVPAEPPDREFVRLRAGEADTAERRRVEDFLLQRCLDLVTEAGLPVKIHLGQLGGSDAPAYRHVFDDVVDVVSLVQANPRTTFVLMHIAWPQQEQLLALAKHQQNVVIDLCWAWILAPLATREFLTRALTMLPVGKLLCFGGDYITVENVVGHAEIARRGLQSTLAHLVDCDWLTPSGAAELVPALMHGNAERIFDRKERSSRSK